MIHQLPAPNLALIGFMAAGKTTVGEALSRRTGLPFHDVDALIEQGEGETIETIFATKGEAYFRAREKSVFREVCEGVGQIVGCGGGTLIDPTNRTILMARCYAIWLRVSEAEILRRVVRPDAPVRPLMKGGDPVHLIPELLRSRETYYARANLVVDSDRLGTEEIVEAILRAIGWDRPGEA